MGYSYAVLGSGRQGVAAAYDLLKFGEADAVVLADYNLKIAEAAAARLKSLLGDVPVEAAQIDVSDQASLTEFLRQIDCIVSAVPYKFNFGISQACTEAKTHMCDLGGNTDVVWQQLGLHEKAAEAGICIIPDNGLQPGMGNTLAVHGMNQMDDPRHVRIWVGGLAQDPRPPFDFLLSFHIEGLTNEYDEKSINLIEGKRVTLDAFEDLELLTFPEPVGECEAFLTTGGTSTAPWSFEGKLDTYVEKTVRYKGHCEKFKAFRDLGLFGREPVEVGGVSVVPRDFYHQLLEDKIFYPQDKDLIVLRIAVEGFDNGQPKKVVLEMIDFQDEAAGFRAMERTTGFPPAIVAYLMVSGQIEPGAVPLEKSVPPELFLKELNKRDLELKITIS